MDSRRKRSLRGFHQIVSAGFSFFISFLRPMVRSGKSTRGIPFFSRLRLGADLRLDNHVICSGIFQRKMSVGQGRKHTQGNIEVHEESPVLEGQIKSNEQG